ncbi:DUF417 family protein [Pandoraea anhela]|uniref:Inner membrane protein RclC n=1 Tax=Pandoraea anhela TaxID=2508295 RepID=A0A5E4S1L0_9BURK|nr:DUF417 family protein [Pandoraea anhela]VVD69686.1 Inner membrane protein RclC [Pandoraea anhela]
MQPFQASCPTCLRLERLAYQFALYSVVVIFIGYGAYKFTAYEAAAIFPLVSSHPLLSWLYRIVSTQGVSNLIGVFELAAALAMAYPRNWRVRVAGSLGVALTLVVTLSFIVTTPNFGGSAFGFLIKDLSLLGIALFVAAHTLVKGHEQSLHGPRHPAAQ